MKKFICVMILSALIVPSVIQAFTIGVVMGNLDNPYFVQMAVAAEEQAKLFGVETTVLNANYDSATQLSQVETLLQRKVDAIVINPTDSVALIPAAEAAYKAGVPFVCVDRNVETNHISMNIESDNYMAGKLCAEYIAKRLNGRGKIAILLGTLGINVTRDRTNGFIDEINKYPEIKIVAQQTGNFNMAEGMSVAESILTAHPDLDAIYSENDPMALGAVQAIKQLGYKKDIFIVSIDGAPNALEVVKNGGYIAMTVAQQPRKMTILGTTIAYLLANDFKVEDPDNDQRYIVEVVAVSKENVNEWLNKSVEGWH